MPVRYPVDKTIILSICLLNVQRKENLPETTTFWRTFYIK
ncbi:hypothetical protein HMPREF6485_0747 [Segatella buccae ATCC 33574]|uniref:Uncharacterized protein n=1 Tax=Segatella buccae ATCC 33574 TaxID=873513 RepID=E6K534_9BACT|nr:hypothetical protein HMPREF6485_0747 [Segatella buccae ATCC 33574]